MDEKDRLLGCLLGLATGDAVGTTLEFQPPRQLYTHFRHGRRRSL
jgi:ADP-ribosylglycohydrolase